jgi:hypothetical protein
MKLNLTESQRNIASCLLEIFVPISRIAEEPLTTMAQIRRTLTNSHKTPLLLSYSLISDMRQTLLQETRTANETCGFPVRICCYFDELTLQEAQEDREREENKNQSKSSSETRLQKKRPSGPSDANDSIIRGECEEESHNSLTLCEEPSLVETDEDFSDFDAKRFYCSGLCTRGRRVENWMKSTKRYKWCHEERSGTDVWKM